MFLFCLIPINLSDPFIQLIKAEIGASAVGDSRCPSESRKKLKAEDENRWNNVTSSASFYVARIWTVTRFQAYEIGTFLSSDIVLKGQCTRANICYKQFLIVTKINVTCQLITKFPDMRSFLLTTNANMSDFSRRITLRLSFLNWSAGGVPHYHAQNWVEHVTSPQLASWWVAEVVAREVLCQSWRGTDISTAACP